MSLPFDKIFESYRILGHLINSNNIEISSDVFMYRVMRPRRAKTSPDRRKQTERLGSDQSAAVVAAAAVSVAVGRGGGGGGGGGDVA